MNTTTDRRIVLWFPIFNTGGAVSHTAASITEGMIERGAFATMWVPTSDPRAMKPFIRNGIPLNLRSLAYKLAGSDRINRFAEKRYVAALRSGDVAYMWPGTSVDAFRRARDRGAIVVTENINCHTATARAILDREAAVLGIPLDHPITDETIARERAILETVDFVFSPSPSVTASLQENGVPEQKILSGSYGWDPKRIGPSNGQSRPLDGRFRALFVGAVEVRKGAVRLLDAWERAAVPGELQFAGRVSDAVLKLRENSFARADVIRLGFVDNVCDAFRSADAFVFPSLEEGSPLVTYEAMACGLPIVVSPMGAGGVARGEEDGAIILPHDDLDGWAGAIRRLAADRDLRAEFGRRAAQRALEFTWPRCAAVRLARLTEAIETRQANSFPAESAPGGERTSVANRI